MTVGMKSQAAVCGMCVAIKGPAPSTPNPADNVGVVGEYYAYVYDVRHRRCCRGRPSRLTGALA